MLDKITNIMVYLGIALIIWMFLSWLEVILFESACTLNFYRFFVAYVEWAETIF